MNIQFNTAPPPAPGSRETVSPPPRRAPELPAQAAQAPAAPPGVEPIRQAARQINDFLKSAKADVEFSVDSESNHVVVRVVDSQTRQVIRQIPSEDMIALSKSMEQMTGMLIRQKST